MRVLLFVARWCSLFDARIVLLFGAAVVCCWLLFGVVRCCCLFVIVAVYCVFCSCALLCVVMRWCASFGNVRCSLLFFGGCFVGVNGCLVLSLVFSVAVGVYACCLRLFAVVCCVLLIAVVVCRCVSLL